MGVLHRYPKRSFCLAAPHREIDMTTDGCIDSASMYEVLAALSFTDSRHCYPWARGTALGVTITLFDPDAEHLRMAASPGTTTLGASGPYEALTTSLLRSNIVGATPPPTHVAEAALAETRTWAVAEARALREVVTRLKDDELNFQPWLDWVMRFAWDENVARMSTLVTPELITEVAAVIDAEQSAVEHISLLSRDRHWIEWLVRRRPNTEEFHLLVDAYIAAALIRGKYHYRTAARMNWQAMGHPLRRCARPLLSANEQQPYVVPAGVSHLATILMEDAIRQNRADLSARARAWVENALKARSACLGPCPAIDLRSALEADTEDAAITWAVDQAVVLGIGQPGKSFERAVNLAVGTGLMYVTSFVLSPPVAFGLGTAVMLGQEALGSAGHVTAKRTRHRRLLRRLAQAGPGAVDPTWG